MKTITSTTVLALAIFAAGAARARADEDIITKSFSVERGGRLVMNVDRGSIHITTSDSDKVEMKIEREVRRASSAEAKQILEQHKINMTQSGNDVTVEARNPQGPGWSGDRFKRLQVAYTLGIPARFDVDLRTAGGNIEVGDLEGKVVLHTSGGNLKLGSIKGPIKAHTSGGNVSLAANVGNADLHTSGGDLRLGEIEGDLVARTSGGSIHIERIKGTANAETSGGNVRVKEAYGPVVARTSGGNVSAQLNEQPKSACSLRTSGGNVEVQLAENLALAVDARTSGGSIHSDFPGTLNKQKTQLSAQLNGGGTDLLLETSGGNVNIRRK
jgi:DUF4097 and DUF4098 domain-containing protein YvlB